MHPLAAPGTLWVLSRVGKYLVRPQAGETSHKKQISCGWQGKEPFFLFPYHRGFRLCGGDQGAFRSPFGNLRPFAAHGGFHKKQIPCGRQEKKPSWLFPVSRKVSPLRRRPKGFPIALWKPSGAIPVEVNGSHKKWISCGWQGKELYFLFSVFLGAFASAEATRGLSGRPLDSFGGEQKLCHDAVLAGCESKGFTFTWVYKKRARFSAAYACGRSFRSGHALFIAFSKLPDGTAPAWGKSPTSPPASAG